MRHITERGLALITRFEGFRATAYRCPAGYLTIGYGHVLSGAHVPDEELPTITEEEARGLLKQDVLLAEKALARLITARLSDNRFDALVSFTYNVGVAALQRSTLRQKVNRGEHVEVANELLKWCKVRGRVLPGLLKRRQAEAVMYGAVI